MRTRRTTSYLQQKRRRRDAGAGSLAPPTAQLQDVLELNEPVGGTVASDLDRDDDGLREAQAFRRIRSGFSLAPPTAQLQDALELSEPVGGMVA